MKTILKKYFADLDEAKKFSNEKGREMAGAGYDHWNCCVWDAYDDNHWENGQWCRYCVIADVW